MRTALFSARPHLASYDSPAVYYSFVFALPPDTDIYKLTDCLLQRDIADSAAFSGGERLSFSYRFNQRRQGQQKLRDMASLENVIKGELPFRTWARKHPQLAAWLIRKRYVRISPGSKKTPTPKLAAEFEELRSLANSVDHDMLDVGLFTGLASAVDRELFAPSYLATAPYVRLKLATIRAETTRWPDTDLEPFLLLHRCGVAILTFASIPGQKRTTKDLLALASSKNIYFTRTVFPLSLGKLLPHDPTRASATQLNSNGREWRDVTWTDPIPLQALFGGYGDLICELAAGPGSAVGEWMCYTTLFIDGLHCCGSKKRWLTHHKAELAGLVMRNVDYATIKQSIVDRTLAADCALHEYDSDYFETGSGLRIKWQFAPAIEKTSPSSHFYMTALIEGELVKYWQLRTLEQRLSATHWTQSNLEKVQQQLITGLEEYRSTKVVFGSAQDIERRLSEALGLDRTYQHILDRLDAIQRLIDARNASLANRRNLLFAGISAVAAVLFGMSAINDLLNVASRVDTHGFPGFLARPLEHFARLGNNGEWELYVSLIAAMCLTSMAIFFSRFAKEHRSIVRSFGVEWDSISYSMHSEPRQRLNQPDRSTQSSESQHDSDVYESKPRALKAVFRRRRLGPR